VSSSSVSPSVSDISLLEALEGPALLVGPDGQVRCANQAAAAWAGLASTSEMVGAPCADWLSRIRAPGAARLSVPAIDAPELIERVERGGVPRRVYQRVSRAVRDASGETSARLEYFADLTPQIRAEDGRSRVEAELARERASYQERIDQLERYKMELTANVTHDLRTPLASIKASVSALLAGDVEYDPRELRETLTLIEEETDRLQRRVQNLLSMAKMESGGGPLSRDWADIADMVGSAMESLRSIRGTREVRLDFPPDLPMVFVDYDQLQIAVRNLIENAFLYSPPDKPLEVSGSTSLGQLRIRVRDYGPGLMPDEFEQVFEKFYRGRSARRTPGTGLGLPICRGIAEAHGGSLWAEHAPGGGVAFVLSVPLQDAPEAPEES